MDSTDNKEILDLATKLNIPIYIDPDFKNINFINDIKYRKIETAISVSYPKIIPSIFFKIFKNGMFNFHPAKLPNYRGSYPTMWPILNGDTYASYTLHMIDKVIDTGPIVNNININIKINKIDTGWSLYKKLLTILPLFIKESIDAIFSENKNYSIQTIKDANYYSKDIPNNGLIDFAWDGPYIVNFVRALYSPIHCSAYFIKDKKNRNNGEDGGGVYNILILLLLFFFCFLQ